MAIQDMVNVLAEMSEKEINMVLAFAKFNAYLTENLGQAINHATMTNYSGMVNDILKTIYLSHEELRATKLCIRRL